MQPTRVIAVDWSGARTGEQRKIWLAEIALGAGGGSAAGGQLVRLCEGWTRETVTAELVSAVHESVACAERLVIGLDFSFGFPAWYSQQNGWRSGQEVWSAWTAERVEQTLTSPAFPFWGRGAIRTKPPELRDDSETPPLRTTERESAVGGPRPFSVFQLVGAGAVGVGSLRGMATLRALNNAGAAVWPFDICFAVAPAESATAVAAVSENERDARERTADALVLEIWPRLYAPHVNKSNAEHRLLHVRSLALWKTLVRNTTESLALSQSGIVAQMENDISRSDDAFDALMGALALWSARADFVPLPQIASEAERLEGRMWRLSTPLR